MGDQQQSWPDWKYPAWRNLGGILTPQRWLEGRRQEDGAEDLWRVHDGLYDLSSWIGSHPGGAQWLEVTKGTDITEAFEAHHVGPAASKMLVNFFVRHTSTPRNSPFTFKENGFFKVFKSRAYEVLKNVKPGPSTHSKYLLDTLATGSVLLSVLAAMYRSFLLGALAGSFVCLTTICAHNFIHMRNNWRMYYFNMSLLSVRQWRISHALSHHLFPNTHYDLEVSMLEPFMVYLPDPKKSKIFGMVSAICSPLIYPFISIGETIKRTLLSPFHAEDLIGLLLPTTMIVIGQVPVVTAFEMWIFIILVGSFLFGAISLNAAHHHPDIFHYGDKPGEDRDWGLHNLYATRDRVEVYGATSLVLVTFGDHLLHHMFPTVDHAHLHSLYPILEQTCKEFGIDFKLKTTWDMIKGQFYQLMRNEPNLNEPRY